MTNIKFRTGAIALAISAFLLPACTNEPEVGITQDEENVTTEEVAENTEDYLGQEITVRSEVNQKVDEAAFTLNDSRFFNGDEILVINATGAPFILPEDDTEVQVTGEVQQFNIVEFEQGYGLDLDPQVYAEYEEQPAIVAQSLALAPEPQEIAANPDQYYNYPIAVQGEVDEVYSPNSFKLEGEDLLVIVPGSDFTQEDEVVTIVGEVRPFILADLERDYDLTWDLDVQEKIEAEYQEKPVMIAREVYPSAQE
ncbi:MAG: hypothetical protein SAL07_02695 [Oscillatoria sp. PMC 1051.18]|uniref:hypothetical protein n=1 Tax=Oscillatoria salina TaxID=331517 RepID=UPI001CC94C41|nr:hypothetical protein [Oscillatoria salina]MBZ8182952.1 hypothetical protein [Oscillatoria salina IIICB1]MEC4892263.1 hypothetical protein [Oscillatoria sp. PMC 1050.18]MEC5028796.1 hypothetical protein [Oscillatoria sp. PMC 1051.18]